MKILHLIDSLNTGGAERMAVGYVNALAERNFEVYLWSSREEGALKKEVHPDVKYHFLNRKGTVGFRALFKAWKLIREHKIQIVHAHSTSYFFGTLLKWGKPSIKLIWHDHYGNRVKSKSTHKKPLIYCSTFFDATFAVNQDLKEWHQENLKSRLNFYFPNFVVFQKNTVHKNNNFFKNKTLICVANFRNPKNHSNLISAFLKVNEKYPEWKLLLIGNDFQDEYASNLRKQIANLNLDEAITIIRGVSNVTPYLLTASIGLLSSDSEGLPLAILEYGFSGLAVVCTDVGYCREVVKENGKVVPANDSQALADAVLEYIQQPNQAVLDAEQLQKHVLETYSAAAVLPQVTAIYERVLKK